MGRDQRRDVLLIDEEFQAPAPCLILCMVFLKLCLPKSTLQVHICYSGWEERPSFFFRLWLLRRMLTGLDNVAVSAAGSLPLLVPQDPMVQSRQQAGGAGGTGMAYAGSLNRRAHSINCSQGLVSQISTVMKNRVHRDSRPSPEPYA